MSALPGHTFTFAELLGRAPKPAPETPKTAPVAARQPGDPLPPFAGSLANVVTSRGRQSRKAATAPRTVGKTAKAAEQAPARPKPASLTKRTKALSFNHLAPASDGYEFEAETPTAARGLASKIVTAGNLRQHAHCLA